MAQGTIQWYNPQKGYGLIKQGQNNQYVFVHIHDLIEPKNSTLKEGQTVEFELGLGVKGPVANQVRVL